MTDIYHITHIDNLNAILTSGGLFAKSRLQNNSIHYRDIAHQNIQDRRATIPVHCSQRGTLHDYVPFYFAPRSPMLYTISKGNVENYTEGQDPVIYLVSEAEIIAYSALPFAFTDGHPLITYVQFYENINHLEFIDWKVMECKYWGSTPEDPNRKCRRQAEFLVHHFLPWQFIIEIGVINPIYKSRVETILQNIKNIDYPPVTVYRNWYY